MAIKLIFMGLKLPFLYIFPLRYYAVARREFLLCLSHAHDYETMQKKSPLFNSSLLAIQLRLITIVELSRSDRKSRKKCEQRKVADVRERQILSNAEEEIVCNFHE